MHISSNKVHLMYNVDDYVVNVGYSKADEIPMYL